VRAAVGEFEAVLRAQIAETRRGLAAARAARDYEGIKTCGLRLRYLLDIAEEHGVEVSEAPAPKPGASRTDEGGV
jgi:hypothetical protein